MKKRIIKRKFSLNKFFRGIGLVLALTLTLTLVIKGSATGALQTEYKQVVVKNGDTIWKIAGENKSNETNLEEFMYTIRQVNKLKDSELQPGQIIKVPLNF